MNTPQEMMHAALDGSLSAEDEQKFCDWLGESPTHVQQFAELTLLHDQLRQLHQAQFIDQHSLEQVPFDQAAIETRSLLPEPALLLSKAEPIINAAPNKARRTLRMINVSILLATMMLACGLAWVGLSSQYATAGSELSRIMHAQAEIHDRTFRIRVNERRVGGRDRPIPNDDRRRPPKPPLDGAILHLRGNRQFVLIRQVPDGGSFITGSNGIESWTVKSRGPVKVTRDHEQFQRDLPGHEHGMPLNDLNSGLARLAKAYELQLAPLQADSDSANDATRLLIAIKKRGERGPKRVSVTYEERSGLIQEMNFVDMPYGADRLDVDVLFVDAKPLPPNFFDHAAHHDPRRLLRLNKGSQRT